METAEHELAKCKAQEKKVTHLEQRVNSLEQTDQGRRGEILGLEASNTTVAEVCEAFEDVTHKLLLNANGLF